MSTVKLEVIESDDDAQLRNRKDSRLQNRKDSKPPTGKLGDKDRETPQQQKPQQQQQQSDTDKVKSPIGDSTERLNILCEQLRQEIVNELQDHLKLTVDCAVERLMRHTESDDSLRSSNWLEKKYALSSALSLVLVFRARDASVLGLRPIPAFFSAA
ncbi:unnamed protein product [Schistocephalus solidus]|uniref:Uncharacterized protein n=1 Tax=Schistocephalus solidus TaxID=70667 RepID=A0A183SX17_SCHSO|nr:unnamed protein product [Schistocephalus solidus]